MSAHDEQQRRAFNGIFESWVPGVDPEGRGGDETLKFPRAPIVFPGRLKSQREAESNSPFTTDHYPLHKTKHHLKFVWAVGDITPKIARQEESLRVFSRACSFFEYCTVAREGW